MVEGETLRALLAGLSPQLEETEFVFTSHPARPDPPPADAVVVVSEAEGWTVVVPRDEAVRRGWRHRFACRRITLAVHSDLEAVGLTAAVAAALAEAGIPANVVAGFHHDYVFVPADRADEALAVLENLSRRAGAGD
ncbi:MAG: hypothetical protein KatS3mg119_2424 [Rhodothalassiaceae bacterium]|nr:MAG: hypothetical protein KatS3mg119_2424 [Rhodothalassiaceae bacterium]